MAMISHRTVSEMIEDQGEEVVVAEEATDLTIKKVAKVAASSTQGKVIEINNRIMMRVKKRQKQMMTMMKKTSMRMTSKLKN